MKPQLSVLLPTIRPHLLRRSLGSIPLAARGLEHEVVVVADFAPFEEYLDGIAHGWITWIARSRRGVVDAANTAFAAATGDFVFLFNDESVLDENALAAVYNEAIKNPRRLLSPRHLPEFRFEYYSREFVPFVFVQKELIQREFFGTFLDPVYRGFYSDPDLSLRAHSLSVPLHVVETAILRHHNEHDAPHHQAVSTFLAQDRGTFRARWDHLGEFKDP